MKKTEHVKKLKLRKEIVHVLTATELTAVVGGEGCTAQANTQSHHSKTTTDGTANPTC